MKVITIVSTRPEIIRLSKTIKALDKALGKNHVLVHTGQNFTPELYQTFFEELKLRQPNVKFNLDSPRFGFDFGGYIMNEMERFLKNYDPLFDKILILGDTNGAFYSSIVAKRLGFKIFHMEAGNRCWDDRVPEEMNRKIIDTLSYKLLPYTQRSRENLLREGYHPKDIIVTGNPIVEVVQEIGLDIKDEEYVLVTFHRSENINDKYVMEQFIKQVNKIAKNTKVILSAHPSFSFKYIDSDLNFNDNVEVMTPCNLKDFLSLEASAQCVITDSGTVPEECAMFGTKCILLRDSTERPELLEVNQMVVRNPIDFYNTYLKMKDLTNTTLPRDYRGRVSSIVTKLMIGDL